MQVIGMYGYVDKYDFIIATARTLNIMDKSVLVIDATSDNKYKYIVPTIDNNTSYITKYCDIDFAVGFESYEALEEFLKEKNIEIRKALAVRPLPVRWLVYYMLIMAIVVFGAYGSGYIPVNPMYANF